MKILIACEESQTVCKEFRSIGHEAFSCDIIDCSGNHPEWHLKGDVFEYIGQGWDMMIAHPPCTFICTSGERWMNDPRYPNRKQDRKNAIEFFMKLANADIPKIAIENPIGVMSTHYRKPDQIVDMTWFGEPYNKKTCLWLKNLPKLKPTNIVEGDRITLGSGKKIPKWYSDAASKKDRSKIRSKTFVGFAKAMAEQWGK